MPVLACSNGRWRIGTGPCVYKTKESAESAYRGYLYYKNASESLETMPDWMRNLFDQRVDLAQEWVGFFFEAIENGFFDCVPYAWVKFHQKYKRSKTEGVWAEIQRRNA